MAENNLHETLFLDFSKECLAQGRNLELFSIVYNIAYEAHEGDYRETGEKFICHPLRSARFLLNLHFDDVVILATLLHDVLEKTEMYPEKLERILYTKVKGHVYSERIEKSIVSKVMELVNDITFNFKRDKKETIYIQLATSLDNLNNPKKDPYYLEDKWSAFEKEVFYPHLNEIREHANFFYKKLKNIEMSIKEKKNYKTLTRAIEESRHKNQKTPLAINSFKQAILQSIEKRFTFKNLQKIIVKFYNLSPLELEEFSNLVAKRGDTPPTPLLNVRVIFNRRLNSEDLFQDFSQFIRSIGDGFYIKRLFHSHIESDSICAIISNFDKDYADFSYRIVLDTEESFYTKERGYFNTQKNSIRKEKDLINVAEQEFPISNKNMTFHDLVFSIDVKSALSLEIVYAIEKETLGIREIDKRVKLGDLNYQKERFEIKTSERVKPKFNWFKYLETDTAINSLVSYFSITYGDGTIQGFKEKIRETASNSEWIEIRQQIAIEFFNEISTMYVSKYKNNE
ncbi:HD domain-containing protein [Enterococcus wangshanyuanii]|uniref:HD/PDEase domain-containing protein n=1 Tax=Enterococcus wangshanyuanii TaxID=2005703 RepID=A0ABQ1PIM0_9ENTE|nr:HD domain-containing protein [Enterococcus wangshanyuanii]GGC97830.1 hypothetical protein GCM10011573_29200 [Enterococcus wangshanyuanii]